MARQRAKQPGIPGSGKSSGSSGRGGDHSNVSSSPGGGRSASANANGENHSSSSSTGGTAKLRQTQAHKSDEKRSLVIMSKWRIAFGCCCLAVAGYFGYLGYLETRVNTPFDDQKMVQRGGNNDPDQYWGSYRPGTYFGMKTRDPYSLVMGLMWYFPSKLGPGGTGIRHWCEIDDRLNKYGWVRHDGRTFGVQHIQDGNVKLETSFVKFPGGQFGGDWTARISVTGDDKEELSLIWYTAFDEKTSGWMTPTLGDSIIGTRGETPGVGEFQLKFHAVNGTVINKSYLSTMVEDLKQLRESVKVNLRLLGDKKLDRNFIVLAGEMLKSQSGEMLEPNFIATQITIRPPFTLDIGFNSLTNTELTMDQTEPLIGQDYTEILSTRIATFDQKFEENFHLREKGYSSPEIEFAKSTFSNLIGGIGYFYGSSRVQSVHTKEPVPYWRAPLYTAVPSRSFFPRGFLWDEGFHGLLISTWDLDIQLDILNHWFDLMNVEGWIPREQILGVEALAKVPEEFVTQRNSNANPPTFFILLRRILSKVGKTELRSRNRLQNLDRLFPRLQAWFLWFNNTQKGEIPGTYRWRGRDEDSVRELNPKTLTSGLDDFPRASHPNDKERHLDLRCWIAYAAGVMADLARILGQDGSKYLETYLYLTDNNLLNELHLSPYTETYSDYGLHTDSVALKRPQVKHSPHQSQVPPPQELVRVTLKNPELRFVDSTFGYVSLFPFLLEILTPDSPYLGKLLTNLRDPGVLWSDFGIRSLSKTAPLYMKKNTEHDPPYWRGQIWINLNYLTLKALHHYGSQPGPFSDQAKKIYVELRNNVVSNIIKEYTRTGFVWEQYNDKTGHGSGCHPFTGWTSLIVLIMAESY